MIRILIVLQGLMFALAPAHAGPFVSGGDPSNLLCSKPSVVDAYYVAIFSDLFTESTSVELVVPTGETTVERYSANCRQAEDTGKLKLSCLVAGAQGQEYWVTLSVRKNRLVATANQIRTEKPQKLSDCKYQ